MKLKKILHVVLYYLHFQAHAESLTTYAHGKGVGGTTAASYLVLTSYLGLALSNDSNIACK